MYNNSDGTDSGDVGCEISDILCQYLVRHGNPSSRGDLTRRLVQEGATVQDITAICEVQESFGDGLAAAAARIGKILRTDGWKVYAAEAIYALDAKVIRDTRLEQKVEAKRGRRKRGPVNMPADLQVENEKESRIFEAYIRERVSDGKTIEWVMEHENMTEGQVRAILAAGS